MPIIKLKKNIKKILKAVRPSKLSIKRARLVLMGVSATLVAAFLAYNLYFWGRVYPGVSVAGIYLGAKSPEQALAYLSQNVQVPQKIILSSGSQTYDIPLENIDVKYDLIGSTRAAFETARTGNILYDLWQRTLLIFEGKNIGLRLSLDEEKLSTELGLISDQVATQSREPSVTLVKGQVVVDKGSPGSDIDTSELRIKIGEALAFAKNEPIVIPLARVDPTISDNEASLLEERANSLVNKSLKLKFEYQTFTYSASDLLSLLSPGGAYDDKAIGEIVTSVGTRIERAPQEPVFVFEGGKVKQFEPSKSGVAVKIDELATLIKQSVKTLETGSDKTASIDIPTTLSVPKYTTGDVNNLGIKELIGRGVSRFRGSIANRIHNIQLAASRFKGILVAPGETFSFNESLGDVSELTGFKQAYIIKEGKTVLGDGGGVCQVSTTLFRAALDAGLPIVARTAHAYRVGYYEQDSPPGFDATVYAPSPDLKILNDTPGHILIQATADTSTSTLIFEIYGTSDGRVATTSKPVVTDQVAPPEDLYVDDPTLPAGTIKQIDYKAWGAKVTFNYLVTRAGETIYKKTFVSNYHPWQAVFLRGTAPLN